MKNERQLKILSIISDRAIHTQEELKDALLAEGYNVTQATVSRDIKYLRLQKIAGEDGLLRYAIQPTEETRREETLERYRQVLEQVLVSAVPAGNIACVKTLSGTASAAAAALESTLYQNIIGTLAGDDTLLCLFAGENAAMEFCQHLNARYIRN
ncbi:MAG: arginine repressor [Clostridia bacterium]|nr:arginine repressor [Clostridia bacterium]